MAAACAVAGAIKDHHSKGAVTYEPPHLRSYCSIDVLPFLIGRKWDGRALAFVHCLRPSYIRVTSGEETSDAKCWRVTVHVDANDIIRSIDQEVQVGLAHDWQHGHDANQWARSANPHEAKP